MKATYTVVKGQVSQPHSLDALKATYPVVEELLRHGLAQITLKATYATDIPGLSSCTGVSSFEATYSVVKESHSHRDRPWLLEATNPVV